MLRRERLLLATVAALLLAAGRGRRRGGAALVPNGVHGWYWQLPQPAGAGGRHVRSLVPRPTPTCGRSGSAGLVQHSADAGQTWSVQAHGQRRRPVVGELRRRTARRAAAGTAGCL